MGNEKVNKYFYSVVFFLLYFALSFSSHAKSEDFDKVCSYFQELEKLVNVNTMTHLQHNDYILGKLNNIPPASNARVAWEAIASAIPEQRYELYKSSAESVLNQKWQCSAMERLAPKTGEF